MTYKYRLSDIGILLEQQDPYEKYEPVNCPDYERYCGTWCKKFVAGGDSAIVKCGEVEIYLELEE